MAPITVANFLDNLNSGYFVDTLVHRSIPGFVIQGGGFHAADATPIPNHGTIPLEYSLPNERGTIAMARMSAPDTATTQWFINTVDNSAGLAPGGFSPDGYAVFGHVLGNGMDVVDAIAAVQTFNFNGAFTNLPLINYTNGAPNPLDYAVVVNSITVVPEPSSVLLAACGVAVLSIWGRRRRRLTARP